VIGNALRTAGLVPRALAAWAGTDRVSMLPIEELREREPTPAATALALFVAGRDVPVDRLHVPLDELVERGLVERDSKTVHAEVAILPVARALIVCDRYDAPPTSDTVCWPDDSSYHLAGAIPHARVERWLDLGCGSAFAPLVRPEVARVIAGVDLNAEATRMAALGVELSGVQHVTIHTGDLALDRPSADLVTCNAPMPSRGIEMWRHTDDELFERLWHVVPERVAAGGLAVIHAAVAAMPLERLAGDKRVVIYTPPDATPAFGVLWWQPHAPERLAISHRALTAERPHLDDGDRGS
jgi:hypothetical protein